MIRIPGLGSVRYQLPPVLAEPNFCLGELNSLVIAVFPKRLLLNQFLLPCLALVVSAAIAVPPTAIAQQSTTTWKTWDQTFHWEEPVTEYRWEEQEVVETSYKKKMVPVYQTETVEKKSITYRPVKKTSERVENYTEMEPVTVTKYREREVQETKYDTVTEMREESYISRRPVIETVMRDKEFKVRAKVTENGFQYRDITTYKPTAVAETALVPTNVLVPATAAADRLRMQWLRPGYYTDPASGLTAWRRRGLHWAMPAAPAGAVVPALVPQTTAATVYVPEVSRKAEPVEISRYVDRVETRKVPVEVERIEERVETRKVPVEVKRARKVTRVEKIPYTETTYREVERTRRVPVVEETMQKVETIEPVEKTTAKWVEKQEAIETPKIVRRKVAYTTTKKVPYLVKMRVRVDSYGNNIGEPEAVDAQWRAFFKALQEKGQSANFENAESGKSMKSVVEKPKYDKSSIYYTDPSFQPLNAPEPTPSDRAASDRAAAADTVPSLIETAADVPPKVNRVSKPKVGGDNRVRSILVPETKQNFIPSTKMKMLGGAPIKVEIDSGKTKTSARTSIPVDDSAIENKFAAPITTKTETSLKPAWQTFDPQVIKQPAVPKTAPVAKSDDAVFVPDIDQVDALKRQPISDIY